MLPMLRTGSPLAPFAESPINRLGTLFDRVFGEDGFNPSPAWGGIPVAVWVDDDHVTVELELPGVVASDVEISFHDGMLHVRGERRAEEGRRYLYNGRTFGRFERVIGLPAAVDADAAQARYEAGVLRVALPKRPEAKPKTIRLQAS